MIVSIRSQPIFAKVCRLEIHHWSAKEINADHSKSYLLDHLIIFTMDKENVKPFKAQGGGNPRTNVTASAFHRSSSKSNIPRIIENHQRAILGNHGRVNDYS